MISFETKSIFKDEFGSINEWIMHCGEGSATFYQVQGHIDDNNYPKEIISFLNKDGNRSFAPMDNIMNFMFITSLSHINFREFFEILNDHFTGESFIVPSAQVCTPDAVSLFGFRIGKYWLWPSEYEHGRRDWLNVIANLVPKDTAFGDNGIAFSNNHDVFYGEFVAGKLTVQNFKLWALQ